MRHIISVLLENEAGALSRVVGLFSARGYNIETLTVAPGLASCTPIAAGRPKPMVPRPPELIQRRGWSNL